MPRMSVEKKVYKKRTKRLKGRGGGSELQKKEGLLFLS